MLIDSNVQSQTPDAGSLSTKISAPIIVEISSEEQEQGLLSPASLTTAIAAIERDGYVILNNAVSHDSIDRLRHKMSEDAQYLIDRGRWNTVGNVTGHLNQAPPPFAPYVFSDIVCNVFAAQVTQSMLGTGRFNRFYRCNSNIPGSGMQPLHWDGIEKALIVNVGLEDITEANGSIELWPGTHQLENFVEPMGTVQSEPIDNAISETIREARRQVIPPIRGNTKKGSILIRHEEVWHRGMPNLSTEPRYMIAMMHYRFGTSIGDPMRFHSNCESIFADRTLYPNLQFTTETIDYLGTKKSLSQHLRDMAYRFAPDVYSKLTNVRKFYKGLRH